MEKPSLHSLLFRAELKSLGGGKRWNTLVFLVVIDFLALFSLGAGQEILAFLEEKMDNDYVQLLVATVPGGTCDDEEWKIQLLENGSFQSQFGIDTIKPMAKQFMNFRLNDTTQAKLVGGFRDANHPLWSMILSDTSNFLTSAAISAPFDHPVKGTGIILTKKTATDLGVWPLPVGELSVVNWVVDDSSRRVVPMPVLGITKYLPLKLDAALLESTMNYLESGKAADDRGIDYYFISDSLFRRTDLSFPNRIRCLSGFLHPTAAFNEEGRFLNTYASKVSLRHTYLQADEPDYEFLLFRLSELQNARTLAAELKENKKNYGCDPKEDNGALEIDLTDVENKENLGIFSKFARLLSFAVVVLALILIINYTGAILRMHISQNKRNLGTLMAFGYENQTITRLYLVITSVLLGAAFVISYVLVWPIGYLGLELFLLASGLDNVASEVAFSHIPIYYSVMLFVAVPLAIVSYRIRKQLTATPGDLVYDR